jgi:hypothetical protein
MFNFKLMPLKCLAGLTLGLTLFSGVSFADTIYLPDIAPLPDPSLYAKQYGDFYSYSTVILEAHGWPVVQSAPGQIGSAVPVLTTNAAGAAKNDPGMDNAYRTNASGNNGSTFSTAINGANLGKDQFGGAIAGTNINQSQSTTWDISLSTLNTFLDGKSLVFLFDNNQNQGNGSDRLQAYGEVILWNSGYGEIKSSVANNVYSLFDFVGMNGTTDGVFHGNVNNYANATLNLNANIAQTAYVDIPFSETDPTTGIPYTLNIGTNVADFALIAPELNALLKDSRYDTLSIFMDFGNRTGGSEQVFLARVDTATTPEPGTMLLMGAGVAGAAFLRRRRAAKGV